MSKTTDAVMDSMNRIILTSTLISKGEWEGEWKVKDPSRITKRFLNEMYDALYAEVDKILKQVNPCEIQKIKHCGVKDIVICRGYASGEKELCCGAFLDEPSCKHWSKNGCTVKSLRCKAWVCDTVRLGFNDTYITPVFKNGIRISSSRSRIMSKKHYAILANIELFRFHLLFREGKTKTVEAAYQSFAAEKKANKEVQNA